MKKLLLFVAAATMFAACSKDTTHDLSINRQIDKLYVSIGDDDSRIQLDENCRTVWNEGDMVSVFNKTNGNECWQFDGKTGDKQETLSRVSGNAGTTNMDKVIALYPYDPNCAVSGNMISTTIPATQTYTADSFGDGGNIMVAVSDVEDLQFKHIFAWIKLSLTDNLERSVESITFSGNNDEKLTGSALIDVSTQKVYISGNTKSLMLDCGNGVQLSADTPTYFYIAVLPQTFSKGVSVTVIMTNGTSIEKHHEDSFAVTCNHIQPVKATNFQLVNNIIFYKTSDDKTVNMYTTEGFGANFVSNNYVNGQGIIHFNGNITTIPSEAFKNCSNLTSIAIPDSVTSIGSAAFRYCRNLTSVNIPNSITSIGEYTFWYCHCLTSITIPDSVTEIGNHAFDGCRRMTSVTIGNNSVTSIGDYAFNGCSSLTSIIIPNSVTKIGEYAFWRCDSLTSVNIPDSVTLIGNGAFRDCSSMTNITISQRITSIGERTFYGCNSLTSVNIPDGVTSIGDDAFFACRGLTSITIPDSVTSIRDRAFCGCSGLESITISDSVTYIGVHAFTSCSNLTSIYCFAMTPPIIYNNTFHDVSSCTLYVPRGCKEAYSADKNWSIFTKIVEF